MGTNPRIVYEDFAMYLKWKKASFKKRNNLIIILKNKILNHCFLFQSSAWEHTWTIRHLINYGLLQYNPTNQQVIPFILLNLLLVLQAPLAPVLLGPSFPLFTACCTSM